MRVHRADIEAFENNARVVAVLVDVGWLNCWPFEWTRAGARAIRRHTVGVQGRHYDAAALFQEAERIAVIIFGEEPKGGDNGSTVRQKNGYGGC